MEAGPALIKPNLYELSLLLGREVGPDDAAAECASLYGSTGTEVLCTLGATARFLQEKRACSA